MPLSVLNAATRSGEPDRGLFETAEYAAVNTFFRSRPDLRASPLQRLPGLAAQAGIADILLKDESARFGLNAFKVVGVTYALDRLLADGRIRRDQTVVCATSGNHGRAVARGAREHGLNAKVYVPHDTVLARIDAIANEGAEVVVSTGDYELAVRQAAGDAAAQGWAVVSDTGWPGYEDIPRLIMAGYTRLLEEAAAEWGKAPPDVVLVQAGVGGLACAVASWFSHRYRARRPFLITCESSAAACLLESIRAGEPVSLQGPFDTVMSGVRCGEISMAIWPSVSRTVDACVGIEDDRVADTVRRLAHPVASDPPVVSGASGACSLACLLAILEEEELRPIRDASGLNPRSRALVFNTEGATDPEYYERVTGRHAPV